VRQRYVRNLNFVMSHRQSVSAFSEREVEALVKGVLSDKGAKATIVSVKRVDTDTPTWNIWLLRSEQHIRFEVAVEPASPPSNLHRAIEQAVAEHLP
jgi:hypothetical protein